MPQVSVPIETLAHNFPLYAKTCLKIKDKRRRILPLELNVGQLKVQAAIRECRKRGRPPRIIELKARQTGMSTDAEARLFHRCHLYGNYGAIVIAHRRESAQIIFEMSKRFLDRLPREVKPEMRYETKSQLAFENGSVFTVEVATKGGGRGLTAQGVHLSELAYYPDPAAVLDAVLQAVPDTTESLVIIESTACGQNEFYDLWTHAEQGHSDFVPIFMPWHEEPTYRMEAKFDEKDMDPEEKVLCEKFHLSLDQIAWRRWCIRNKCRNSRDTFRQEYPTTAREAFLQSGRPIFDKDAIEHYESYAPPMVLVPRYIFRGDITWAPQSDLGFDLQEWSDGPLRIYEHEKPRHIYIAGADPSEGDPGSDPSPIVVMDQMDLNPHAVWDGRLRPDLLALKQAALCLKYNRGQAIWESNNHGLTLQVAIEKIWDSFYWREASKESVSKQVIDKPGFNTNVKTRHFLFNLLRTVVNERKVDLRDWRLIGELANVFYDDHNQIANYPNKTKDLLVAYALCLECHTGGDEKAELVPLEEHDVEVLRQWQRYNYMAASMGIAADSSLAAAQQAVNRQDVTAHDLEELDAKDYARDRRARTVGFVEGS